MFPDKVPRILNSGHNSCYITSGSHPFDHEPQTSSNWFTDRSGSHVPNSQQISNKPNQADIKVKERIVHGSVEFFQDPWSQLADGLSRCRCLDSLTRLPSHDFKLDRSSIRS